MIRCPYCQWDELTETARGYYCSICEREITFDELIIYEEENEE